MLSAYRSMPRCARLGHRRLNILLGRPARREARARASDLPRGEPARARVQLPFRRTVSRGLVDFTVDAAMVRSGKTILQSGSKPGRR